MSDPVPELVQVREEEMDKAQSTQYRVHRQSSAQTKVLQEQPIGNLSRVQQECDQQPSPELRRKVRKSILAATMNPPAGRPKPNVDETDCTQSLIAIKLYFTHKGKKIPTGLAACTYKDDGVTRHLLFPYQVDGQDFAQELDIRDEDELLVVGDTAVIDRSSDVLINTCLTLDINKPVTLMTRRVREEKKIIHDQKNAFYYFTIITTIELYDGRICATQIDRSKYEEPDLLVFDPESAKIEEYPAFVSTLNDNKYLGINQGQLFLGTLTTDPKWKFAVAEYWGYHPWYGDVTVVTFKHEEAGLATFIQASKNGHIEVASATNVKDQDRKHLFIKHEGHFYESVHFLGHFMKLVDGKELCLARQDFDPNTMSRDDYFKIKVQEV